MLQITLRFAFLNSLFSSFLRIKFNLRRCFFPNHAVIIDEQIRAVQFPPISSAYRNFLFEAILLVDLCRSHQPIAIVFFTKLFCLSLFNNGSVGEKKRFEELYGVVRPDVIHAHPPNVVKCKGSGSRLPSKIEAAKKAASKPPRQCGKCHKMVNHDSKRRVKYINKLVVPITIVSVYWHT
ncbi:hypothetical protein SASPL_140191 [Salvia splendens]|uniref:Uncharacterized protein n=1 Tax=Salvia splendens TaxID=180675 RepID=A0A8X8WPK1_SALSN|nr:hypothetical protein SASPL_140191 [Salvia splendens]